jgi:Ni/Fe-hydrogenase subunit HybB-like protein
MSVPVSVQRTEGRALRLPRITFWRLFAAASIAVGLYATYMRFVHGLGASTALSDAFPWGIWVGFDVLCGVGLAAGGFTITAAVHLFGMKHLKPIVRPAVLTAFLGYLLVSAGLLYDLGKPWNIWHPTVMWNPHSVMFEVAWCVMLYTTVMALEFSPIVFERFGLSGPLKIVKRLTIPLVLAGVLLSTMHQSSLGTVFLIFPSKLHPLWYSTALPVFFFVSAIAAGLSMVIFESYLSFRFLGHRLKPEVLMSLARGSVVVLSVYLVMRVFDVIYRGAAGYVFQPGMESGLFLLELGLGVLLPIFLFSNDRVVKSRRGLFIAASCVVIGFVLGRLNVSITGFEASSGTSYFPSFLELSVTVMLVVAGFIGFGLAVKHLPVFGKH